jgi:hypothetical protein
MYTGVDPYLYWNNDNEPKRQMSKQKKIYNMGTPYIPMLYDAK